MKTRRRSTVRHASPTMSGTEEVSVNNRHRPRRALRDPVWRPKLFPAVPDDRVAALSEEPESGDSAGGSAYEVLARAVDEDGLSGAVLLLSAMSIPYVLRDVDGAVELLVPVAESARARREIALTRAEEREPRPVMAELRGGVRAAVPAGVALLVTHAVLTSLSDARRAAIYAAGELDSARVRAGQVYRAVTALTLHADAAHVVGNAAATAIFVGAAGDWVGPGVALLCTILAGITGNLGAALIDPGHRAIGFSTATFGALGLTAVFGFVARYRDRVARRRAWLALGAGLALLAVLGAGERSDVLAHLLGLAAGVGLGLLVSRGGRLSARRPVAPGPLAQGVAAACGGALIVLAWAFAWASAHPAASR